MNNKIRNMQTQVKELPGSKVELKIEVPWLELRPYLEGGVYQISLKSEVAGFRKGKAPYEVIKREFGEMKILKEALDQILTYTYFKAIQKENLETCSEPEIKIEKIAPGNPLVFSACVFVLPQIKLIDYRKLQIKRQKIEVRQREIDQALKDLQKMRAKEILVDRETQNGDKAEIDFSIFIDKIPLEDGQYKKYPLFLGENQMIPGFEEQIIGMRKDERKEFTLKFPKSYFRKELAGKKAQFEVKINKVYQVEKPEINDEFVKNLGNFKNLKDLKVKLENNLKEEKEFEEEKRVEIKILNQIIDKSQFGELPSVLIDNESRVIIEEIKNHLRRYDIDFKNWLEKIKKSEENLQKDLESQAIRRVKGTLVMRKIAFDEEIKVQDEEIKDEINNILRLYPSDVEVREQIESRTYRDCLKQQLGQKKTLEWLKRQIVTN